MTLNNRSYRASRFHCSKFTDDVYPAKRNLMDFVHEGRNAPKKFINSVTNEEPKTISTLRLIHHPKQTFKNLVPTMPSIRVNSLQLFGLLNLKMENFQLLQKFSTRIAEQDRPCYCRPSFFRRIYRTNKNTDAFHLALQVPWFQQGGKTSSKQKNGIAHDSEVWS